MIQTIMVIDDEIEILDMLKRYFTLEGYDVITAAGGNEALQKLAKQPDLILLDINMPDIDGLSLCKNIRDFVSCPILFLTANVEDSDKIKGFGAGGDDYIVKPFSIDELGARVSAHLRRENRSKTKSRVWFDEQLAIDYAAQHGKCAVTGSIMEAHDIHCHHKKPVAKGGTDEYGTSFLYRLQSTNLSMLLTKPL